MVLCPDLGWVVSLTQDRVPDVSTVLTQCILSTFLVLEEWWRTRQTMAFTVRGEEPTLLLLLITQP